MKNYIDVNKDKLGIVFDHANELEDGDTVLIADKTCVWECRIMKTKHKVGFDDGKLPIIRADLTVMGYPYVDEDGLKHYDEQIVTLKQFETFKQFNKDAKIII